MAVPNIFANVTTSIPLSQLDANFATAITLGNTAVYLGNTTTTIGNLTLTNANVSSVSTPITPAQGGTGLATLTANNVLIGNGTSNVTFVAPGTSGNVLTSNGTVWSSSAAPTGSAATQTALGTVYGKQDTSGLAFYGYQAANSTTGVNTTAIGYQALYSNTTGTNNTIIGAGAGYAITSTNHVAIGRNANTASTNGDRCTVIGSAANPSASSTDAEIVIGYGVTGQADSYITMGSNLGKIYNAYKTNATWTQTSDGRLKKNIQPDTLGLSFVCRLNPVTYQWKPSNEIDKNLPYYNETNERDTETVMHGFVAQEVKAALDAEGCSTFNGWDAGNHEGIQAISREMFISPLVKAIQELKVLVDAQATEIAELKAKVGA